MKHFSDLRINTKFVLWFLAISLIPLIIAIIISYNSSRRALQEEVTNSLFAVADNRANQIENYLIQKKKDASALAYLPEITNAVDKFTASFRNSGLDSAQYIAVDEELRPMLTYYQRSLGYDSILIISPDGDTVFSTADTKSAKSIYEIALYNKDSELAKVFIKAKDSQETAISNFEFNTQAQSGVAFIATPVFKDANLIGTVVEQISSQGLYEFVQDYTGLGNSGEITLVSRLKDEAVFIAPVRFDSEAAFRRKIKIGSNERSDIQKAAMGENGSGKSLDYRGKEVLAVWRHLPSLQLGMVITMDTEEVFASANKLRNSLLRIGLLLLIIIVVIAIVIARTISRPIKDLTVTSKTISAGDLAARARIAARDEIGELAHSFNQMTDKLVEAKANVEQKKAEVEEQKRLLEEANKELDSFVYTVSHDLRAPLRGVEGFAAFLEQDYANKLDDQGKDFVNRIRSGVNRMQQMIDDLLTLSRISRIKNPFEDVDMEELIKSVIERVDFDLRKHKVELKIAVGLPIVHCDKIKMAEAFLNLISNAIKFSSKNKDFAPRIEIGYNDKDDAYEFYVKDNGIGIEKKYHKEIFGIFKRLHRQDEYEGTGAGLGIVKRIIEDHQGSIWVDSELGQGATFYFSIPKELKARKKLGQILIDEGCVTEEDIKRALKKQGLEET